MNKNGDTISGNLLLSAETRLLGYSDLSDTKILSLVHRDRSTGFQSFAVNEPAFWNTLPEHLRDHSLTITAFKQRLKSFLFSQHS
jgi:hypothetical protein